MASRWETNRGDEWWYTNYWCKLDAGFNSAFPGVLSIDKLDFKPGQITEDRIHSLLWVTRQQFKENKIEILKENELNKVIDALREKGVVEVKPIDSPSSRYFQIINVSEPETQIETQYDDIKSKAWWKFW